VRKDREKREKQREGKQKERREEDKVLSKEGQR
jgi:hypothetical protein